MTDLLAIGTRKGLWLALSEDDRRTWTLGEPHLLAQEVAAVGIDTRRDRPRVLAGIQYGHWGPSVVRSDDLGATWQETDEGAVRFPADTGAALARVWQLRPDSADRPDVVWAGCEPHSLWRSTDGGCTFDLVRGLWDHPHRPTWEPGAGGGAVHTVLPDPGSDRVTVAMSGGGVYVSEDGGGGWEPRNRGISAVFLPEPAPEYGQCVHKVAADAGDPGRMYAQNHFGVFRTDDAGRSWTSIADGLPADFGFPVAASPRTPGTAWVVPLVADMERVPPAGRLRVHRTRDVGATWTESAAGLPDAAWTAVLRDAFCVDEGDPTGVYVGTRDGCVYASRDEGETFELVVDHLPDVLAVRAARLA
ncbi:exo-alpha-sialidase [Blastococcus sp. TML/M2B]|uniref:sialidase family protein n=1 Tax=unclassified Blastococcus TaxID=2619396 RepID=UPI00190BF5E0|nr:MULTISPECIES: sialidase family protein [unclassified Blastococcus]MBN1091975.1 exo-alpha-sialidase [Blastococcus sp. TML/M2B]MBN1097923.1 exo-alpha-sialidase [Blastococcus sp. TML/C7B]